MTDTAKSPLPGAAAGRLPLFNVVGFTGHRHLADPGGASLAIREALALLVREVPGEGIALSSIARGGDQLFVSEARAAGMSWHCILPLARPVFARDFAPEETRLPSRTSRNALWLRADAGAAVTCVQIAGLIARRILCYVKAGDRLKRGDRLGFIRLGSRVDLYLPVDARVRVELGQKVHGGSTMVAEL